MKERIDSIISKIESSGTNIKFEVMNFDSGAVMIDLVKEDLFYCIQGHNGLFGISQITENTDICTLPDSGYLEWKEFLTAFESIEILKR